jgi:hypothetical protein
VLEGVAGGLDGEVDVGLVGLGDVGQHVAGPRVPGLERLACEYGGNAFRDKARILFFSRKKTVISSV